jgi:hypothetical protein
MANAMPLAPEPAPSLWIKYQQACFALCKRGHVVGIRLTAMQFRVLAYLLSERPGLVIYQKHIAKALQCSTKQVYRALKALRRLKLVDAPMILAEHPLPWKYNGKPARWDNRVLRYWVDTERVTVEAPRQGPRLVEPVENVSSDGTLESTSPKYERETVQTASPTPPREPAELGAEEGPHAPSGHRVASETPGSGGGAAGESAHAHRRRRKRESGEGGESTPHAATPAQLDALGKAWDGLGLRDHYGNSTAGPRERKAFENRMGEGCSAEEIADAIAGAAGHRDWFEKRAGRCFAIVFADVCSVRRFAAEGRSASGGGVRGPDRGAGKARETQEHSDFVRRRQERIDALEQLGKRWEQEGKAP